MPKHSFTPRATKLAQAAKKEGLSLRAIAAKLKKELGFDVDHVTIGRHLDRIAGKGRKRGDQRAPSPQTKKPPAQQAKDSALPPSNVETTLDESKALEVQVIRLQQLLAGDMPPKDRAALNSELRATFASIRKAKTVADQVKDNDSEDLSFMVEKLKRFAEANRSADGIAEETDAVPQERDSACG